MFDDSASMASARSSLASESLSIEPGENGRLPLLSVTNARSAPCLGGREGSGNHIHVFLSLSRLERSPYCTLTADLRALHADPLLRHRQAWPVQEDQRPSGAAAHPGGPCWPRSAQPLRAMSPQGPWHQGSGLGACY